MEKRRTIIVARKMIYFAMAISIFMSLIALLMMHDFSSAILCIVVGVLVGGNLYTVVDICKGEGTVSFVLLNGKTFDMEISALKKIRNFRNSTYIISVENRRPFIAYESFSVAVQVSDGETTHRGIEAEDFPQAQYIFF